MNTVKLWHNGNVFDCPVHPSAQYNTELSTRKHRNVTPFTPRRVACRTWNTWYATTPVIPMGETAIIMYEVKV